MAKREFTENQVIYDLHSFNFIFHKCCILSGDILLFFHITLLSTNIQFMAEPNKLWTGQGRVWCNLIHPNRARDWLQNKFIVWWQVAWKWYGKILSHSTAITSLAFYSCQCIKFNMSNYKSQTTDSLFWQPKCLFNNLNFFLATDNLNIFFRSYRNENGIAR